MHIFFFKVACIASRLQGILWVAAQREEAPVALGLEAGGEEAPGAC